MSDRTPSLALSVLLSLGCGRSVDSEKAATSVPLEDAGFSAAFDASSGGAAGDAGACASATVTAVKPSVDIVFVIDQSGSMENEIASVRANINRLAETLEKSGLDYRVVMIAGYDGKSVRADGTAAGTSYRVVCVPPPLGGATCGAPGPKFRHSNVDTVENLLRVLVQSYDMTGPGLAWSDFVRPAAMKVIVPITDDESRGAGVSLEGAPPCKPPTPASPCEWWFNGLTAEQFDYRMLRKPGAPFGTPEARRYVVYPIIGTPPYPAESPKCDARIDGLGSEYVKLAKLTKGKWFSICLSDYGPLFAEMAKAIGARLACEVGIPAPPSGETIDYGKINVTFASSAGQRDTVKQDTSAPCESGANGWQYSADKSKVLLCGDACKRAESDPGSSLTVGFGCATIIK